MTATYAGKTPRISALSIASALLCVALLLFAGCSTKTSTADGNDSGDKLEITNVSYDPTRELYAEYNELFAKHYNEQTGKDVVITQSHGGSGAQARSVTEGAKADVVTLALAHDITLIEEARMIEPGWESEFAGESSPYTSTIVFLVRSGNPKKIADWDDLVSEDVDIITPSPKSSGAACWSFLAAWRYADEKYGGDEDKVKKFMADMYGNVSVMDSGARGATTTFVENGQGDVLISWENEAIASMESHPGEYEIITPSISILAQPSVAIVDENADKNGTQDIAKDYLEYLYSDEAQRIVAKNGYRPSNEEILAEFEDKFDLDVKLCTIGDFGGWNAAYEKYFDDGAIFDEVYE